MYFVWLRFGLVLASGVYLVYFVLAPFWSLRGYLVYFVCLRFGLVLASGGTWYTSFWLRFGGSGGTWYTSFGSVWPCFSLRNYLVYFVCLRFGLVLACGGGILRFGSVLEPPGVLGILRLVPFWACFSLRGHLVYFVLAPFWSLRGYLVYFVWFRLGLALACGGTWYTSFGSVLGLL